MECLACYPPHVENWNNHSFEMLPIVYNHWRFRLCKHLLCLLANWLYLRFFFSKRLFSFLILQFTCYLVALFSPQATVSGSRTLLQNPGSCYEWLVLLIKNMVFRRMYTTLKYFLLY